MKKVVLEFPCETVSEANVRCHWRTRHNRAKAQKDAAYAQMLSLGIPKPAPLPIEITLTRIAPRLLDTDNLRSALKAVRDGVARAIGHDDKPENGVKWKYGQVKSGSNKVYRVQIEINWLIL